MEKRMSHFQPGWHFLTLNLSWLYLASQLLYHHRSVHTYVSAPDQSLLSSSSLSGLFAEFCDFSSWYFTTKKMKFLSFSLLSSVRINKIWIGIWPWWKLNYCKICMNLFSQHFKKNISFSKEALSVTLYWRIRIIACNNFRSISYFFKCQ